MPTLNGGVVVLLGPSGGQSVHLGKRLRKRLQREETTRHSLVVSIAHKGRADDQPDDGAIQKSAA